MRNKGFIVTLTLIVTALCLYYLSFTLVSSNIQKDATAYATVLGEDGQPRIDFNKKQKYLDSLWNEPVYNFLGKPFTFKEVKETELGLGLDLQGGMAVTLEVSPVEIVRGIAGNSKDEDFTAALNAANAAFRQTGGDFVGLFASAWKSQTDRKMSEVFANAANKGRISLDTSDDAILKVLNTEVEGAIDRSFNILRTRVDRFGTSQPNIQRLQGTGRIQVELPGVDNPERVRKLLQGVAKLEFFEVYNIQEYQQSLMAINQKLVAEQKVNPLAAGELKTDADAVVQSSDEDDLASLTGDDAAVPADSASEAQAAADSLEAVMNANVSPLLALNMSPYGLVYNVKDTVKINRIIERADIKSLLPRDLKFAWDVKATDNEGVQMLTLNALKTRRGQAPLTGEVITDARQDFDQTGRAAVSMQMNSVGAKKWKKLTSENIGRQVAIVLDGYAYSAPVVNGEIPNGSSSISGNFSIEEAKDLANILKAGSLPAPTRIVEEAVVGPTLGKEAQNQGIYSVLLGLGLVVLFMVAFYAKGGLIANAALLFNIFFILGILANLSAALTLPGIAGIVLTIGMSIDANVLIFERIREEMRLGSSILNAINRGYEKAFSSIFDANVTTFLIGVILYVLGQGPVKGFAITLMIGIASSFFSAVFITRVIVSWLTKKGEQSKLSFETGLSKGFMQNVNFDFMGIRKKVYIGSISFILLGAVLIVAEGGLNLGVDFKGGRSYVVDFGKSMVASDVKTGLSKVEAFQKAGIEVKTYGASDVLKVTTSYLVEDDSDEADVQVRQAIISGLEQSTGLKNISDANNVTEADFAVVSSSKVGATIADDIKASSLEAGFFALIVLFLYILIRFRKMGFSAGAIAALVHDTCFVFAAFAIVALFGVNYEIDQVFVAAILTIIGYSINDTVVVFDRIREDMALNQGKDMEAVFNKAINNTMSRTLMTSATTLIVVLVLFLFGGEVLRSFSFAMLVGVLVGTYSSIFVATPIVLDFTYGEEKRKAKKAGKSVTA
ncbi:protein translocase subunit SecDF [Persicobacter diffluens]|uniref:Multifunctional fusion protein n=1 Tax=Persicobacter diffluens TaxID=981 RepID=A0AAN4W052_9BACT|nr:protein translocase subunit SecDF [Persicobacter diffluens]